MGTPASNDGPLEPQTELEDELSPVSITLYPPGEVFITFREEHGCISSAEPAFQSIPEARYALERALRMLKLAE